MLNQYAFKFHWMLRLCVISVYLRVTLVQDHDTQNIHENIILQPGIVIKSLGKLTIEGYIQHLEKSHIGISLMASPHPSYPPLEMATFGLYTITNKFENKDISKNHPMIHSIDYPLPEDVSKELKKAVDYVKTKSYKIITATIPTNMNKVSWARNIEGAHIAPINSNNLK